MRVKTDPIISPKAARPGRPKALRCAESSAGKERLASQRSAQGAISLKQGQVEQSNFDGFRPPYITDGPVAVDVHIVPTDAPVGVGEAAVPVCQEIYNSAWKALSSKLGLASSLSLCSDTQLSCSKMLFESCAIQLLPGVGWLSKASKPIGQDDAGDLDAGRS